MNGIHEGARPPPKAGRVGVDFGCAGGGERHVQIKQANEGLGTHSKVSMMANYE